MVKSGEESTQPGALKKLITKRQNLAGARFESSEQKSQAGNLIWWHKNKHQ
jgi:hypothetical protein